MSVAPLLAKEENVGTTEYNRFSWNDYKKWFSENSKPGKSADGTVLKSITKEQLGALNTKFHWKMDPHSLSKLFEAFDDDRESDDGDKAGCGLLEIEEFQGLVGEAVDVAGNDEWRKVAIDKKEKFEEAVRNAKGELLKTLQKCTELSKGPKRAPEQIADAGRGFDEKIQALSGLWKSMTPHMFKKLLHAFSVFDNDPVEFLQSFTMPVYRTCQSPGKVKTLSADCENPDDMPHYRHRLCSQFDVMLAWTETGYNWKEDTWKSAVKNQFKKMGGNMPCPFSSMWTRTTHCRTSTEYRFQYTSAAWLFDPSMEAEFADIVQTIRDMGVESGIYGTFAARACLLQAWHCVEDLYIGHVFMDSYFIGLFFLIGYDGHKAVHPSLVLLLLVMVGVARSIGCLIVEVFSAYEHAHWDFKKFFDSYLGHPHTIFTIMMQMFEIGVPFLLVKHEWNLDCHGSDNDYVRDWNHSPTEGQCSCPKDSSGNTISCSYLKEHSVFLAYLVGTKCVLLLQYMLATRFFGEQVIPAYKALIHPNHTSFICFLILCVLSCFFSYFMFPVKDGEMDDILWTFMAMFRLAIPGDFDLGDLEGVNGIEVMDQIAYKDDGQILNMTGFSDDGEPNHKIHHGVTGFFVVVTVLVNVMLLNVYIGLLSGLYDLYADKSAQHFENFRAQIGWKLLLARRGWRRVFRLGMESKDNPYPNCVPSHMGKDNKFQANPNAHIWIAYNPAIFKEEKDDAAVAYAKIDKMYSTLMTMNDRLAKLEGGK